MNKPSAFKPGDQVVAKAGGLPMTVDEVRAGKVTCVGTDGKKKTFSAEALKPFKRRKASPVIFG